MKQLPLPIGDAPVHSFENFVVGPNALLVDHMQRLVLGKTPVYLWAPAGGGKTHLLEALAAQVQRGGGRVSWFSPHVALPWQFDETASLVVLDGCDAYDAEQQHAAFTLFVDATTHELPVAAAGRLPPVDLPLREDLRTRLGWGHVFAIETLSDADTRAALRREADRRGILLADDMLDHLLTRYPRRIASLLEQLERLDRFSLSTHRPVSVHLLRRMVAEEGAPAVPLPRSDAAPAPTPDP